MSIAVDSVFAVPSEMPDLASSISLIARITKSDPRELLAKCRAAQDILLGGAQSGCGNRRAHRSLNLRGIYFQKESKRFYPKRELAAQVMGYVGMDDEGLSGIEREYDAKLRACPGGCSSRWTLTEVVRQRGETTRARRKRRPDD